MAQVALHHLGAVDARTAVILKGCGLLERDSLDDRGDQREIVAIFANSDHPKRIPVSLGPSVAVRQDDTQRLVIPVALLVLSSERAVRETAVEHIDRMLGHDPSQLTPRTKDILRESRAALLSTESPAWRDAAVHVHDAIKDDFLCNLAGLRQSAELGFDEGIAEYLRAVLRPTVTSLDSIDLELWNPEQQRSTIDEFIEKVVADSRDIVEAVDRYYTRLGHVPLGDNLGVGEVVRRWAVRRGAAGEAWDTIWEWARRTPSTVPRYHACVAVVSNPNLIVPEHRAELWRAILEILHDSTSDKDGAESSEAWLVRCELARHYCHHLECRLPGAESERIAALAWWLAERVASLLAKSPGQIRAFRAETMDHESSLSSQIWHLAHPRVMPSSLRYATLYFKSIWSVSLASLLARALPALDPRSLNVEERARVDAALKRCLFGMFPPSLKSEGEDTYAFERGVHETARVWAELVPAADPVSSVSSVAAATSQLGQLDRLEAELQRLDKSHQAEQMLVAHALAVRSHLNKAPADLLFELLADDRWRNQVFRDGDEGAVQLLFDGVRELTLQKNDKWAWDLPHRFALTCEASWDLPERRALLFAMVVLLSLGTDTVSALQRLLTPARRGDLSSDIKYWCERMQEVRTLAPPWIAARLRAVLASLDVADVG
ncbi:MAG: hypothetical protein ACHQ4J_03450 [Candidatus Binatia bacterium]